jgi:putative glycosyltransferase (TIGR04372 family)
MRTWLKTRIASLLNDRIGRSIAQFLHWLVRTQKSNNVLIFNFGAFFLSLTSSLLERYTLRLVFWLKDSKFRSHENNGKFDKHTSKSYALDFISSNTENNVTRWTFPADLFGQFLVRQNLDANTQLSFGPTLTAAGRLALSSQIYADLCQRSLHYFDLSLRIDVLTKAGISLFLLGDMEGAECYWQQAGELKRFIRAEECGPSYRILGDNWFIAIGHFAALGYYVKYNKLFWNNAIRIVSTASVDKVPGSYLVEKYMAQGVSFLSSDELEEDYNVWARANGKRLWHQLTAVEKYAKVDDFWFLDFPNEDVLSYPQAFGKIQKAWEQQELSPIFQTTDAEKVTLKMMTRSLGLPDGAWYVCLHVRESGFHQGWNSVYPSMRDGNIKDYDGAIDLINRKGGWVIRMGDPTMTPLVNRKGVIDYALSNFKYNSADILLLTGCKFFLGTNSGFSTIPALFDIPCALTNWAPVGLPLWETDNLMIHKNLKSTITNQILSLSDIFTRQLAYIQNCNELPYDLLLIGNTPTEITTLAETAYSLFCESNLTNNLNVSNEYAELLEHYSGYSGNRLIKLI